MGRELNVKVLILGTLHLRGDELAIRVALVDARDDNQLWGDRYQGKLGGILALQDQIARDVAAKLRLGLTGEEDQRLTKHHTADPEAYLLYREGVFHWGKFSPDGIRTAIEHVKGAQERSELRPRLCRDGPMLPPPGAIHGGRLQNYAEARTYLTRALSIDNSLESRTPGRG